VDPGQPSDRIEFLLRDAAPVLVLREPAVKSTVDGDAGSDLTDADRITALRPSNSRMPSTRRLDRATQGCAGRAPQPGEPGFQPPRRFRGRRGWRAAAGGVERGVLLDTSLEGLVLMADGHELHLLEMTRAREPELLVDYVATNRIDFLDLTPSYGGSSFRRPAQRRAASPKSMMRAGKRWVRRCGRSWPPRRTP